MGMGKKRAVAEKGWWEKEPLASLISDFSFPPFMVEPLNLPNMDHDDYWVNFWMGNIGRVPIGDGSAAVTQTHWDDAPNIFLLLDGAKRFTLHSPNDGVHMFGE